MHTLWWGAEEKIIMFINKEDSYQDVYIRPSMT